MVISLAKADKIAFESFLRERGIRYEDLSTNDNRSQSREQTRNLDYRLPSHAGKEVLIELEGRSLIKGKLQPSKIWLKEDELLALLDWEERNPQARRAIIVYAFRSDQPPADHEVTVSVEDLNYVLVAVAAKDFDQHKKARCAKDGWKTLDLRRGSFATCVKPITSFLT